MFKLWQCFLSVPCCVSLGPSSKFSNNRQRYHYNWAIKRRPSKQIVQIATWNGSTTSQSCHNSFQSRFDGQHKLIFMEMFHMTFIADNHSRAKGYPFERQEEERNASVEYGERENCVSILIPKVVAPTWHVVMKTDQGQCSGFQII